MIVFGALVVWSLIGACALVAVIDISVGLAAVEGFEFVNPRWIYKHFRLNYFGVAIVTLLLNLFCPFGSVGYWFYKLCTVGRK